MKNIRDVFRMRVGFSYPLIVIFLVFFLSLFLFTAGNENIPAFADEESSVITISIDPESQWAKVVRVGIEYPTSQYTKTYRIIRNGVEGEIKNYEGVFEITLEGENIVRAFYEDSSYVDKTVANVDRTPPIEQYITIEIDFGRAQTVLLKVAADDTKSGVDNVFISGYGYEFFKQDSWYEIDLTHVTIGASFTIEIKDKAGNSLTIPYNLTIFDYIEDIRRHANLYQSLGDGRQYTRARWLAIVNKFSNLGIAYQNPDGVDDSEINLILYQIDELIEGSFSYHTQIVEPIEGLDSNVTYAIFDSSLDALLGSEILMEISNSVLTSKERENLVKMLITLSSYKKVKIIPFNLALKEKTGEEVNVIGSMIIEFVPPVNHTRMKLYGISEGVYYEIPLVSSGGRMSGRATSDGDFFLVLDEDSNLFRKGHIINGRFYSYGLFYGTIFGILALLIIAFFVTFSIVNNKDKLSWNKLLSKIKRKSFETKKRKRKKK